jgi:hypothetical protein
MWRTAWARCALGPPLDAAREPSHCIANNNNISPRAWGPVTDSEVLGTHPSPTGKQVSVSHRQRVRLGVRLAANAIVRVTRLHIQLIHRIYLGGGWWAGGMRQGGRRTVGG